VISRANKVIAVVGASGQQGGAVVRALRSAGQFHVRALSRNPSRHLDLGHEVHKADLNQPGGLEAAFTGAHGVFLVTNFWEEGVDEIKQASGAIRAAKAAGVKHLIWSTLPNVEEISGGKFNVPHYTGKAKVDAIVREAGFEHHTFVIPPMYYQNLTGPLAPQKQEDGSLGWTLPLDPGVRGIHMGDINEIGYIVAGAFADPGRAGNGEYLPLVGDFMSFDDIIRTLNSQGHALSFTQVSDEMFPTEIAHTFRFFQEHTYLGAPSLDRIDLANRIAGREPTTLASWAAANFTS